MSEAEPGRRPTAPREAAGGTRDRIKRPGRLGSAAFQPSVPKPAGVFGGNGFLFAARGIRKGMNILHPFTGRRQPIRRNRTSALQGAKQSARVAYAAARPFWRRRNAGLGDLNPHPCGAFPKPWQKRPSSSTGRGRRARLRPQTVFDGKDR